MNRRFSPVQNGAFLRNITMQVLDFIGTYLRQTTVQTGKT